MSIYQKYFLIFIGALFVNEICYSQNGDEVNEDVSFTIIEKVPVFPGCKGNNEELKKCLNLGIQTHIAQNFNSRVAKNLGLKKGKQKIYIQFRITKKGNIEILGVKAPHTELAKEAERVVKKMPKMVPGKQKGKPVNVTYMLPIVFNVKK